MALLKEDTMKTLIMKIVGYDEASQSLEVAFASDQTASQDPSTYPAFAYQPMTMWPDVADVQTIMRNLAVAGMWQAEQQAKKEAFVADPAKVAALAALVGQTIEYPVSELVTPSIYQNEVQL